VCDWRGLGHAGESRIATDKLRWDASTVIYRFVMSRWITYPAVLCGRREVTVWWFAAFVASASEIIQEAKLSLG